jgi:hypothetical protein
MGHLLTHMYEIRAAGLYIRLEETEKSANKDQRYKGENKKQNRLVRPKQQKENQAIRVLGNMLRKKKKLRKE